MKFTNPIKTLSAIDSLLKTQFSIMQCQKKKMNPKTAIEKISNKLLFNYYRFNCNKNKN